MTGAGPGLRGGPPGGPPATMSDKNSQALARAVALQTGGEPLRAIEIYNRILDGEPDNAEIWHLSGVAAHQAGDHELGAKLVAAAIRLDDGPADYHSNLGMILKARGDAKVAEESLRRAIGIEPGHVKALANLAGVLREQGNFAAAVDYAGRAVQAGPGEIDGHINLGNALKDAGDAGAAIGAYRRALAIDPESALAHWNLSLALLLTGDLGAGFTEMSWRWKWSGFPGKRRDFDQPAWDGRPYPGRTLLLHAEQGLGDAIQLIRYCRLSACAGGRLVIECPAQIAPLAECAGYDAEIIIAGTGLPAFDFQAPFFDLPRLFGTELATIPADIPYLAVEAALDRAWGERVAGESAGRAAIGLNWAGNADNPIERFRRLPADRLARLAGVDGVTWYGIQRAPGEDPPAAPEGLGLIDTGTAPLTEAAALIANLDLVITSDTAFAHLAGALGRPVWLLLHHAPDWRWLESGPDSPWYPTMRLFRQRWPGDWGGVFDEVATALGEFLRNRAKAPPGAKA